ncbi:alpha/beta hydrolase [Fusibacter ferrireducens]|uniref:Alpha/beta hydrolase n=1 Tax=Fusibacter ferrireducens TaxID=2785058 RepID=A0ABR9ZTP5_9FIRM|nr:alpha/beta hydrolase [Fusibacter ferrireducens]MBF4692944.1 alpha/beta hydrolase [Fusibacter ferrireducens]
MYYLILGIAVIVLSGYSVAEYFNKKIIYPRNWQYEETLKKEIEDGRISEGYFESLFKVPFEIRSEYGYVIRGYWIQGHEATASKTIIICHGITNNLIRSLKYLEPFISRGYNAVIYDHKNHGKSGGQYTSFGVEEKSDLKRIVDYVVKRTGEASIIGTHGESMGAAIALQHVGIDERISFVIADCSYKDAKSEFAYRLRVENHLPAFPILTLASALNKIKRGFSYDEIAPIEAIKDVQKPILFIHGLSDDYIPYSHSKEMYDLKRGAKALYLVPEARHAMSIAVDRSEYLNQINHFLDQYGF